MVSPVRLEGLRLLSADAKGKAAFYSEILGMSQTGSSQAGACRFGYGGQGAWVEFQSTVASTGYVHKRTDLYWKFAIAVPDLDLAYEQLAAHGVEVSAPHQFQDVGYLAHFSDPEGFQIELIQHWFANNKPAVSVDETLLGGGPTLNLFTLRTANIQLSKEFCEETLGMTLLGIQPVHDYAFTLYFFAHTDEQPPDSDLTAVANREWLYQRPYSVLEFQHLHAADVVRTPNVDEPGYGGLVFSGANLVSVGPFGPLLSTP